MTATHKPIRTPRRSAAHTHAAHVSARQRHLPSRGNQYTANIATSSTVFLIPLVTTNRHGAVPPCAAIALPLRCLTRGHHSGVIPKGNQRAHREKRIVPYSPEQFFAVVADVDSYKKFVPFCVDSKVTRVIDQDTMEAEMSVGFKVRKNRQDT